MYTQKLTTPTLRLDQVKTTATTATLLHPHRQGGEGYMRHLSYFLDLHGSLAIYLPMRMMSEIQKSNHTHKIAANTFVHSLRKNTFCSSPRITISFQKRKSNNYSGCSAETKQEGQKRFSQDNTSLFIRTKYIKMKEYKNTPKHICTFLKYIPPKSHSKKSVNCSVSYWLCRQ